MKTILLINALTLTLAILAEQKLPYGQTWNTVCKIATCLLCSLITLAIFNFFI